MFSFIHAADIHLDSPLLGLQYYDGAPVARLRNATRQAFVNLVDAALREQVAFMLIAGDLYDGAWRDCNTGLFFTQQMSRLREANIPVVVVTGNHDANGTVTKALPLPDNVHILPKTKPKTLTFDHLAVAIHGQSYPSPSVMEDLAAAYPAPVAHLFNIGLLHTSADGRSEHATYAPCSIASLLGKGYDYWALGHIHAREIVHQQPWVVFPGNLQGRHIRETGAKGFVLVTVEDGQVSSADFHPCDVLRWAECAIDVTDARCDDDVFAAVRHGLQEALAGQDEDESLLAVRIRLRGVTEYHNALLHARWQSAIRMQAMEIGYERIWTEKILIQTEPPVLSIESSDSGLRDLRQALQGGELAVAERERLLAECRQFIERLPDELRHGEQAISLEDSDTWQSLIGESRALALARLFPREVAP